MAEFGTFNLGNVLSNVDAIQTARLRQQMFGNEIAEFERQRQDRDALRSASQTAVMTGDVSGLAGLDPAAALQIRQHYDGLSKEKRAEEIATAQAGMEKMARLAAWVKASPDEGTASERWRIARESLPADKRANMPEVYDPNALDHAIMQMQSLDSLLSEIKGGRRTAAMVAFAGAGYADRMAQKESGGDYNAQNPKSSAHGKYQIIDSTWRSVMGYAPRTPENQEIAMERLTEQNARALSRAGLNPSPEVLALAHQQGAGGAIQLLSNPTARAVDIVGADAVLLNGGNEAMSAGEFAQRVMGYYAGGQQPEQPPQPEAPAAPQQDPRLQALVQVYAELGDDDPLKAEAGKRIMQAQGFGDQFTLDNTRFDSAGAPVASQPIQVDQQFRRASSEEAAAYGAVAGQFGPDGRFYAQNLPSGMAIEADGAGGFRMTQGPGVANSARPLTEGQSKDNLYLTMATGALPDLERYEGAIVGASGAANQVVGHLPGGRFMQGEEYQVGRAAAEEFAAAILRKESGAALTESDREWTDARYIPMPGDKPETLKRKKEARLRAVAGLKSGMSASQIRAVEAALDETGGGAGGPVQVNSVAEYNALPPGTPYVDPNGRMGVKR